MKQNSSFLALFSRFSSRKSLFGAMILTCVAFVLYIQFFYDFAEGLPITPSFLTSPLTREAVSSSFEQFEDLVWTVDNKKLFAHLANGESSFYDPHNNVLGSTRFQPQNRYQYQPYVANGYIGSRIPNVGQGFSYDQKTPQSPPEDIINGWPLDNTRYSGAFVAGFYDAQPNTTRTNFFVGDKSRAYESVIAAIPQWTTLQLQATVNGSTYVLDPAAAHKGRISEYVQHLSLDTGIVTTEFTWLDTLRVKYEVLAHREFVTLGLVKLQINNLNSTTVDVSVVDKLDIDTSERTQFLNSGADDQGISLTFQPHMIDYVFGAIYSKVYCSGHATSSRFHNDSIAAQNFTFSVAANSQVSVSKFVGVVSSDLSESLTTEHDVLKTARNTALRFSDPRAVTTSHIAAWAKSRGSSKITFPGDSLLTMTARASLYHLAANTRPDAQGVSAALGVGGLSSDSYGGMVFWDSDLWMLNGILPFSPDHARSIVNYRTYTHKQAIENLRPGDEGAVYPWTSGRFGNCTGTGPCFDYEYHINMAVALGAWEVYLSGNGDDTYLEEVAWPLINDAALFMANYVKYNETLGKYTTTNLTDPDEFANHVDNGAYTNAATSLLMNVAIVAGDRLHKNYSSEFSKIANNVHIPVSELDPNIVLEYSGMNSSAAIKQADVIMLTYPLGNELITHEQAIANMHFYAMKQVSYGPAMTFPIFSIVSSALSTTGCSSQSYLQKSVQPFLRAPFAQFSEQNNDDYATNGGTAPAFPFLTAHGGFLQAIVQGLIGLRYDYVINSAVIEPVLVVDPIALPLIPGGAQVDGVKYRNNSLSITIDADNCIISHKGHQDPRQKGSEIQIRIGVRNEKAGIETLKPGGVLTIPLFRPEPAQVGSVSECQLATFYNITEGVYGDIALAINDGDSYTHWQSNSSGVSKVLIDLHQVRNISRGSISWGDKPPLNWKLSVLKKPEDNPLKILAAVDFGNDLHEKYSFYDPDVELYSEDEVFDQVIKEDVQVNAPFNSTEYYGVILPSKFNTTSFDKQVEGRYFLLEFEGVHDDNDDHGAKLYQVSLF